MALKSHPFLQGINFAKFHLFKPPTGIKIIPTFEQSIYDVKFLSTDFENKSVYNPPSLSNSTIPEKVILTDLVRKNLGWFFPMYKERQLVLTPTKLAYYDPQTEQQKVKILFLMIKSHFFLRVKFLYVQIRLHISDLKRKINSMFKSQIVNTFSR